MLVFVEGGKPENPDKNPRSKDENQQQTQPTYDTGPEKNPGHIGGSRALSPLCHPCSPSKGTCTKPDGNFAAKLKCTRHVIYAGPCLYSSNRPQVSMVYRLINHLGLLVEHEKNSTNSSNSSSVLSTSQVFYHACKP